jgi:hypothetical protein
MIALYLLSIAIAAVFGRKASSDDEPL